MMENIILIYYSNDRRFQKCTNLGQSSKASMILQQVAEYPWPLKLKETISFCFGVDALDEFGCVLLNSTGLDEVNNVF